jgi:hypothetical protein
MMQLTCRGTDRARSHGEGQVVCIPVSAGQQGRRDSRHWCWLAQVGSAWLSIPSTYISTPINMYPTHPCNRHLQKGRQANMSR